MLCILIQFGRLQPLLHLGMSTVVEETSLWVNYLTCAEQSVCFIVWNFHIITVLQVYLTDLSTRESVLLCTNEYPILQLSLQDDTIWVATTDSSVYGWPAEGRTPQKVFEKGGSFLAGNLSFSRARASLEGSAPVSMKVVFFYQIIFLFLKKTHRKHFVFLWGHCKVILFNSY